MKGATSIQERLWELRKDKGLNLEELSKLTGISKSALGSYEKEDFKDADRYLRNPQFVRHVGDAHETVLVQFVEDIFVSFGNAQHISLSF